MTSVNTLQIAKLKGNLVDKLSKSVVLNAWR
jgi:hypothetical protein